MEWLSRLFTDEVQHRVATSVVIFFLTTVVSLFVGRWWGKWRARREWDRKHFLGRIIVSLNIFADGYLKIRTVFERSLEAVFINAAAVDKVIAASHQTTAQNPMLPLEKDDRWFILNFVLNAVAEEFNEGLLKYDAYSGATSPVRSVTYLLWLTCEQLGPDRIRKVRAMMVRKEVLLDLPAQPPKFEQSWHAPRIDTLRQAAQAYQQEPDNFLAIEVYV